MMKHTMSWCQTPPSAPIRPTTVKRSLRLKRPNAQDARGSAGKSQPSQPQDILCLRAELTLDPTPVIQRVEMMAFFRLFDDDLIQDFLWMDCCCKITDKYLLAMTFVYFKRARFSISEHSRMNFFIALYLANTMEEDEEQTKYEIFPWALGKSWRKSFSDFLRQRDKLWARMEYRATVSKRCCEEVMAVMPSHFMWQRRRAEHHSGARRDYGERGQVLVPRGPSASPAPCVLCDHASTAGRTLDLLSSSPPPTYSSPTAYSDSPFPFTLCMEATPPRAKATLRKTRGKAKARAKGKTRAQPSCTQELPRDERGCGSTRDTAMNWVSEE